MNTMNSVNNHPSKKMIWGLYKLWFKFSMFLNDQQIGYLQYPQVADLKPKQNVAPPPPNIKHPQMVPNMCKFPSKPGFLGGVNSHFWGIKGQKNRGTFPQPSHLGKVVWRPSWGGAFQTWPMAFRHWVGECLVDFLWGFFTLFTHQNPDVFSTKHWGISPKHQHLSGIQWTNPFGFWWRISMDRWPVVNHWNDGFFGLESSHFFAKLKRVWVNIYRLDTFLVGWTSIYQLFWGSLGTRVLTHPQIAEVFSLVKCILMTIL